MTWSMRVKHHQKEGVGKFRKHVRVRRDMLIENYHIAFCFCDVLQESPMTIFL